MTRSMADSVTATDIPPGRFNLVAGYVDGLYRWTDDDWLFHHASRLVTIAVSALTHPANVLDVETGDATPHDAALWVNAEVQAGRHPTLYFSIGRYAEIHAELLAMGVADSELEVWAADWTGVPHLIPGTVATQWADPAYGSGGHFDVSLVADYWPGIDPAPQPPAPAPTPAPPPPPPPPLPPAPEPTPPPVPPVDQTRSAWASLAAFFTQDLPAFVQELLRLLGLYRRTP